MIIEAKICLNSTQTSDDGLSISIQPFSDI